MECKRVNLAWAIDRSVLNGSRPEDWWWREFLLGTHFGEPVSVGFVTGKGDAFAMYLGTDMLLFHPTIDEAEALLNVFQLNRSREASSDGRF